MNRRSFRRFAGFALALLAASACRSSSPAPIPPGTSSVALLDRAGDGISSEAPYVGESRLVERLAALRDDRTPGAFDLRLRLAQALLRVGRAEESVALFDELVADARELPMSVDERITRLEFPRAIANLRLGEQENCVAHHNGASCLFPLRPEAVHLRRRGAEAAVVGLEAILERQPGNLVAKWFLTIATQALGREASSIRPEWRLDPASWKPAVPFREFRDVAGPAGVAVNGLAGGCVVDDFDGDGRLDILASASYPIERDSEGGELRLFRNLGDGRFEDVSEAAGLAGIRGGLNLVSADDDNDGDLDVLVLRGGWQADHGRWPNTLLRNQGGRFVDETARAGILRCESTQAAAWADYDGDGRLDLFVGVETGFPSVGRGPVERAVMRLVEAWRRWTRAEEPAHLWHNLGDGSYEDVFPRLGLDLTGWIKGVAWGDYDRDGRPDLYLSRYGATNVLLRNDGPDGAGGWSFSDVTARAGVGEPIFSFPTWFFDFDDDGWDDLFVAGYPRIDASFPSRGLPLELRASPRDEISEFLGRPVDSDDGKPRLYRNRGDGTFEDVTRSAGLWFAMSAMGANFGDLDGDGRLDLYIGTGAPPFDFQVPNRALHNVDGTRFEEVTVAANLGSLAKGHGIAFADIDDDGDQDVYAVLGGAVPGDRFPNALFENPGFGNDMLSLRLEGVEANRSAFGARIEVRIGDAGGNVTRRVFRTVGTGGSFGASPLRQEIGLGRLAEHDEAVLDVEVTWPDRSRSVQRLGPLPAGSAWFVRQGEAPVRVERTSFRLGEDVRTGE